MPLVHRTNPVPQHPTAGGVVVIHCSDPRYQPHFQEFLRQGLDVPRYALLAIPGGAQTLTLIDYLPKFSWSGWRWLKFLVNLTQPERVIVISHDDCRWYLDNRFADASRARARQFDDLRRVRTGLAERFGVATVELYHATMEGERVGFETV